jgi:hypothetical protein
MLYKRFAEGCADGHAHENEMAVTIGRLEGARCGTLLPAIPGTGSIIA